MNKKIISILLMMLFIITYIPLVVISSDNNSIQSDEIYTEDDCGCNSQNEEVNYQYTTENKYEWSDYPLMEDYKLATDPKSLSPKPTLVSTPDDFSWINLDGEDWTSPIQDQGGCGSCWLFAAVGCLECIINVREGIPDLDVDLSEQYVMSCLPNAGSCQGGNANQAFRYIISNRSMGNYHNGILPEECFKYYGIDTRGWDFYQQAFRPVLCDNKCDNWEEMLIPISDFGYYNVDGSPEDIEIIKSQVFTFGPIITSMAVSSSFGPWYNSHNNPDDYYPYENYNAINHNVVIVGWKDDPSIPNGGFWRIKNSWGTNGGYNGFFNIEYGSLRIDNAQIIWVDYDPNNYSFKPTVESGGPYYANIGGTITFDASESFAPESNIILYTWDFGDGTTGNGVIAEHGYSESGDYTVILTVEDDFGNFVTDETAAIIELWNIGDFWTYNIDEIDISLTGNMNLTVEASVQNLKFIVSEITDDHYLFDFEGDLSARVNILLFYKLFRPGIYVTKDGKISGSIKLNKNTFGMDNVTFRLKGKIMPIIGRLPLTIPLPFDITLMNEFDYGYKLLDFPIHVDKKWDFETTFVRMNTKFESTGLNILKIIERIAEILNIPAFPDNWFKRIPGRPNMFNCVSEESVTIDLGTFDAYKISYGIFDEEFLHYYYSPDIGGIIKISSDVTEFQIPNGFLSMNLNGELVETNY